MAGPSCAAQDLAKQIDSAIFPGLQGGPLEHIIAAKAVAFAEAARPEFAAYAAAVVANARALADALAAAGFRLVSGGTDNHMLLIDLRPFDPELTGKEAQEVLDRAGITLNRNTIPDDPRPPFVCSGLRLGTAAETTAGMGPAEMARDRRAHRPHAVEADRGGHHRTGPSRGGRAVRRLPALPGPDRSPRLPLSAGRASREMPPIGWYVLVLVVAAGATAALCIPARWLSLRTGYVAVPEERKVHSRTTPYGGGAAMFMGFLVAMMVAAAIPALRTVFRGSSEPLGVVLAAAAIFGVGLIDDVRDMSAPAKMAGQVLAASILYYMGVTLYEFKVPLAGFFSLTPGVTPLIMAVWVIALTNAINLIDGLDGLAAGRGGHRQGGPRHLRPAPHAAGASSSRQTSACW